MVGFLCATAFNIYWGMTPIFGPGTTSPTPELAAAVHSLDLCQSTVLPVSILEPLSKIPEYLEGIRNLSLVIWCGSSFTFPTIPEKIRALIPINAGYGATEAGPFITQIESQDEHEYMSFSPLMNAGFQHHSKDLYEMVIAKKGYAGGFQQHIFCTFPELNKWHSKDLFSKHPRKEELRRYRGRSDDMIVLSNATNVNPLLIEGILTQHLKVITVLLTGTNKPGVAWLLEVIEPPENGEQKRVLIEELWPVVEKANAVVHEMGRVAFVGREREVVRN
ncbi:hypothetical protein G7Y89_g212 [Cudoniella acicularis]|uniref:AMP-dependent synthetase/ligase domain-containing protein n=1 Tax=Cudoniella acicularis TaxID=354080 RepID=A0A8H4W846_9HELO|nr:hypothetical protein G7Y89_g212 [Cudoniella acicularis]